MIVYKTFKLLDLDWYSVDKDLLKYRNDNNYTGSIVASAKPEYWQDDLYGIQQQYQEQGYTEHNTKIWKSTNQKNYLKFDWQDSMLSQLPLDHAIVTLTRQDPGQILPWHYDRHFMLRRLYPDDSRIIVRILVFMEEWKTGHVLQIQDEMLYNWKRGQAVIWHPTTYHVAANIGLEKKWTCNVTGFLSDDNLVNIINEMEIK